MVGQLKSVIAPHAATSSDTHGPSISGLDNFIYQTQSVTSVRGIFSLNARRGLVSLVNDTLPNSALMWCETALGPMLFEKSFQYQLFFHPKSALASATIVIVEGCAIPKDPSKDIPWFPAPQVRGIFSVANPERGLNPRILVVHSVFQHPDAFPGSTQLQAGVGRRWQSAIDMRALNLTREVQGNPSVPTKITFHLRDDDCGGILSLEEKQEKGQVALLSMLQVEADHAVPACEATLVAYDEHSQEELVVTVIHVSVRDCMDSPAGDDRAEATCGLHGMCLPDPLPFDGLFAGCHCLAGYDGNFCEGNELLVLWPIPEQLPDAVFQVEYATPPVPLVEVRVKDRHETNGSALVRSYQPGSVLPWGIRIDRDTGQVIGTPVQPGSNFSVAIFAEADNELVMVNTRPFRLNVVDCDDAQTCHGGICLDDVPFDSEYSCDCNRTGKTGPVCKDDILEPFTVSWGPGLQDKLPNAVLNQPYQFMPPSADEIFIAGADGIDGYFGSGFPCGLDVTRADGMIGGTPGVAGRYHVTILAESVSAGVSAKINKGLLVLDVVDCNDMLSCNGGTCVDTALMDGVFSCQCDAGRSGTYCEAATVSAASAAGMAVAAVLLILVVVLSILWARRYRAAHKAFDFDATLRQLHAAGLIRDASATDEVDTARHHGGLKVPREIKRKCVAILHDIGNGAFGIVHKGFLDEQADSGIPGFAVAVKVDAPALMLTVPYPIPSIHS